MWHLYNRAEESHRLPSELLGLNWSWYETYCFDEAVMFFGTWIYNKLRAVEGKSDKQTERKREALLKRLLGEGPDKKATGQFADPMDKLKG
jgi:hypothetical protein